MQVTRLRHTTSFAFQLTKKDYKSLGPDAVCNSEIPLALVKHRGTERSPRRKDNLLQVVQKAMWASMVVLKHSSEEDWNDCKLMAISKYVLSTESQNLTKTGSDVSCSDRHGLM